MDQDQLRECSKLVGDLHAEIESAAAHAEAARDGAVAFAPVSAVDWQQLFTTLAQILPVILALFRKSTPPSPVPQSKP